MVVSRNEELNDEFLCVCAGGQVGGGSCADGGRPDNVDSVERMVFCYTKNLGDISEFG